MYAHACVCWFVCVCMYSQVHIYLDTDIIFITVALYATRTEFKLNNQIEIDVQTLSFNSRGWKKYNTKCLWITTIFIHSPPPIFRGSNVIGQINIIINKMLFFLHLVESFAGNECFKSGTHGHHQRLGFLLCDALPILYCSWLQLLFVWGSFCL